MADNSLDIFGGDDGDGGMDDLMSEWAAFEANQSNVLDDTDDFINNIQNQAQQINAEKDRLDEEQAGALQRAIGETDVEATLARARAKEAEEAAKVKAEEDARQAQLEAARLAQQQQEAEAEAERERARARRQEEARQAAEEARQAEAAAAEAALQQQREAAAAAAVANAEAEAARAAAAEAAEAEAAVAAAEAAAAEAAAEAAAAEAAEAEAAAAAAAASANAAADADAAAAAAAAAEAEELNAKSKEVAENGPPGYTKVDNGFLHLEGLDFRDQNAADGTEFTVYVFGFKWVPATADGLYDPSQPPREWTVIDRYSAYRTLYTEMNAIGLKPAAPFPAKRRALWGGTDDNTFKNGRLDALSLYLTDLVQNVATATQHPSLRSFLQITKHTAADYVDSGDAEAAKQARASVGKRSAAARAVAKQAQAQAQAQKPPPPPPPPAPEGPPPAPEAEPQVEKEAEAEAETKAEAQDAASPATPSAAAAAAAAEMSGDSVSIAYDGGTFTATLSGSAVAEGGERVYTIVCGWSMPSLAVTQWTLLKRFNEFSQFKNDISPALRTYVQQQKAAGADSVPALPVFPSRVLNAKFWNAATPEQVEEREAGLRVYLTSLLATFPPAVAMAHSATKAFLQTRRHILAARKEGMSKARSNRDASGRAAGRLNAAPAAAAPSASSSASAASSGLFGPPPTAAASSGGGGGGGLFGDDEPSAASGGGSGLFSSPAPAAAAAPSKACTCGLPLCICGAM